MVICRKDFSVVWVAVVVELLWCESCSMRAVLQELRRTVKADDMCNPTIGP